MRKILLDTSFILSCVEKKIDFFTELHNDGFEIIIPKQVIIELEKISLPTSTHSKTSKEKENSALSLRIILNNVFDKIDLRQNILSSKKSVDDLIIDFVKSNPDIYLATLDKGLQRRADNKKIIIKGKKIEAINS